MEDRGRNVAVVGTGIAGLVTAYLLHHDPQQRFRVHLLDRSPRIPLTAESIAIASIHQGSVWADVPMRAFAGGYHHNLLRMYDHMTSVFVRMRSCDAFPASDLIAYKRLIHQQPHYVILDGVYTVQKKLLRGLDVRLAVETMRVLPTSQGVQLTLHDATGVCTQLIDLVVLAVSPDVAAAIFSAARPSLREVPATTVQTIAHTDISNVVVPLQEGTMLHPVPGSPQLICFCTNGLVTEAIHAQPNGNLITTNPLTSIDPTTIIRSAVFTRVLRTPTSQRVLREIFREDDSTDANSKHDVLVDGLARWCSGDDGV